MNNINTIVLESLSSHFKKHWKKYALGAAGLAAGVGAYAHHGQQQLKKANTEAKHLANVSALADGLYAAHVMHKTIPNGVPYKGLITGVTGGVNGLAGLAAHHVGRKLVDAMVDRKSNRHWWNAGQRAHTKKIVNRLFGASHLAGIAGKTLSNQFQTD